MPKDVPLHRSFTWCLIESCIFLVRPFSFGLRPLSACSRAYCGGRFGNSSFMRNSHSEAESSVVLCFLFLTFVVTLELLVAAIQAYVRDPVLAVHRRGGRSS